MKYTSTCLILMISLLMPLSAETFFEPPSEPWGPDAELAQSGEVKSTKKPKSASRKVCIAMIRFFQKYISPIDGPRSSYFPSSSQYTLEAIQRYGVFHGIALGCDRLMRENGEEWVYDRIVGYGGLRKYDPVR